jgi:hypothetical protein
VLALAPWSALLALTLENRVFAFQRTLALSTLPLLVTMLADLTAATVLTARTTFPVIANRPSAAVLALVLLAVGLTAQDPTIPDADLALNQVLLSRNTILYTRSGWDTHVILLASSYCPKIRFRNNAKLFLPYPKTQLWLTGRPCY